MTSQAQTVGGGTTQTVAKLYDTYGHRTRVTYPNGRNVDKTFNALHQNDLIKTDLGAGIVTIADYDYLYDSGSDKRMLVSKKSLNSGTDTRADFSYDEMGRVTKKNWVDISASTTLVGFEYTYDLFGNRLTDNHLHQSVDSEKYYYDTAQRFTKYERGTIGGSPTFYQGYTLDDLANWSTFDNNGTTESRSHSSTNEVTARGATSLNYDANGNLTDDGNQKYIWDELNRLIQVKDSGNNLIVDYYYYANNLRVEKHHSGGVKEQFYYDGGFVVEDQDGSQALVREFMQGGQYIDEVIVVKTGGNYYYYMYDLRFNEYGFVDSTGAVVERSKYDGYGSRTLMDPSYSTITTPVVDQPYSYTGQRLDNESGLQYYRARYFDNDLGRFINRDPIGYHDGLNLYRGYFVVNGFDPSGQKMVLDDLADKKYFKDLISTLCPDGDFDITSAGQVVSNKPDFCKIEKKKKNSGCFISQNRVSIETENIPTRGCISSSRPVVCCCLCDAINSKNTIYLKNLGDKQRGGKTSFLKGGETEEIRRLNDIRITMGYEIKGGYEGEGDPSMDKGYVRATKDISFAHELCGHAITGLSHELNFNFDAYGPKDGIIQIENTIRGELGSEYGIRTGQ